MSTFERYQEPRAVDSTRVYGRRGIYRASQTSILLARYVRIRGDLIVTWHALSGEQGTTTADLARSTELKQLAAVACADLLNQARAEMEERHMNATAVAHLLSLADRALLSALNDDVLRHRLRMIVDQLQQVEPTPQGHIDNVHRALDEMDSRTREVIEASAKDALTFLGEQDERYLIEDNLQVSRLNKAITFVGIGWLLLMSVLPFVSEAQEDASGNRVWPVNDLGWTDLSSAWTDWLSLLVGALGLSIVGAVGGIISGMFSVRDASTTLREYRASVRRMILKPAVGAVAALIVYFFLNAEVVNGVSVTSAGTYIVVAFLAGFSERYFLRVIEAGVDQGRETRPPPSQQGVRTSALRAAEEAETPSSPRTT